METALVTLTQGQAALTSTVNTLTQALTKFLESQTPSSSNNTPATSTPPESGSSTPPSKSSPPAPAVPSPSSPPTSFREITSLTPDTPLDSYLDQIVTADLEALITPEGHNKVYMAAWYNGSTSKIFDITQWGYNTPSMLEQFWINLINNNLGRECYFHNWGGYDSILSLLPLVNHNKSGLIFQPLVNPSNQLISLKVLQQLKDKNVGLLTIKDSIKLLPGALGKLAKDFQVETQKDHFPHYFFLDSLKDTLSYEGQLPEYKFFEPKRTSKADYDVMVEEFKNKPWSFFKVSKTYISGDIKSLYQILQVYFSNLSKQFPINPLSNLSVPGIAFKIWKTQQLPILNKDNLKVYDLSGSLDSEFREAYKGGILDVYRPHLKGEGYYYDVNSLYPTAMSKAMPVGTPTKINLTVEEFLEAYFFGYVKAIVNAPPTEYIGLLSIKYQGRLISPIGTFEGMFFSEFCHRNYIY